MNSIFNKLNTTGMKLFLVICLLFSFIFISYTSLILYTNKHDVILNKDLTCEFREDIYIGDFVKTINGTILDNKLIDTNEVGVKEVILTYRNRYGLTGHKKFNVEIKDVIEPTVVVKNPNVVEVSSVNDLMDTIFCADDYDDDVSCSIIGDYDLEKVGKYNLKLIAKDKSDNETIKEFVLDVIEKEKKTTSNKGGSSSYTSYKDVYQKYKADNTLIGLDLSKWQGDVDFSKLKEQDVSFVMLKVGGQKEINGEFIVDPKFYDNIKKALEYDIKVGVYFYSYAKTEKEAREQAKWIIDIVNVYNIELPIVFDWENWKYYTKFHISFHTLNKVAKAFMEEVEDNNYKAMLYSSKYYLETIWYREDYTNWLAYYTSNNNYEGDYLMWQLCSDGKIDGIDGYVDIDVMYLE